MKTFEEALQVLNIHRPSGMEMVMRNLQGLRDDVANSADCRELLLAVGNSIFGDAVRLTPPQVYQYAVCAFLAGLAVGIEMEKHEL